MKRQQLTASELILVGFELQDSAAISIDSFLLNYLGVDYFKSPLYGQLNEFLSKCFKKVYKVINGSKFYEWVEVDILD